jgi:hypothetical protein
MKTTLSVVTAIIVPFGFIILAIVFLGHLLRKRRRVVVASRSCSSRSTHSPTDVA